MCGIAGVAHVAPPDEVDRLLRSMARSMAHRGPDDEGVAVVSGDPVVGLCARRLAIQDPGPTGHQPMRSERTGSWVAFNGEIYNGAELQDRLAARGHSFDGHSDTEVLLAAFDAWGPDCVGELRGMFAFAVWDAPARRLFMARDRLGIKPLYLAERPDGGLVFGSEIRTVLASGLVPKRLSDAGLTSYLSLGAVQDPLTLLDGVTALPAGHAATWEAGCLRAGPYWALEAPFAVADGPQDRGTAVAGLRAELEEAVRVHLVSDVPLGVFLSGGIDSSALVGLVSALATEPPRTVSVVFPEQQFSEQPFIRQVSERFGTRHTEVVLDGATMLDEIPGAIDAMDVPTFDGVNTFLVSRAAREAGLTVALSGVGGDELFGGYPSFRTVPQLERLRAMTPGPLSRGAGTLLGRVERSDRHHKLARWLSAKDTDGHAYALQRELFGPATIGGLLGTGKPSSHWELPPLVGDAQNDVSILELGVYMRNVLLRDSDVMSMAHSLEIRVPFLDHRLVEYAAGLSGRWKDGRGTPKALLVDALADLLPHEIVHRKKMGFTLPFQPWMQGPLRHRIGSALSDPEFGGEVAERLDGDAVRAVWARFQAGKGNWTRPWALFVLKTWGEEHLSATSSFGGAQTLLSS